LENGIPVPTLHGDFHYSTFWQHKDSLKLFGTSNGFSALNMRLEMADHTGTHIDSLNHVSIDGGLYGGVSSEEIAGTFGTSRLGIESMPPIFTRGVLADVASFKGVKMLKSSHAITSDELESTLEHGGAEIAPGDALMVATGWAQMWMKDNRGYSATCPGIDMSAAEWAVRKKVSVIGADTWNVEVSPPLKRKAGAVFNTVHQHLIARNGIRLIENMNLETLRRDKVSEFLFVCLPLLIKGGSGSPVTPIAIK
jgi:kynurenine formamidase